jgi:glycosyltransferase involved in cell wall biosynthesis
MNRPRLSVILPNYNHGRYLPLCLESILDQSWPADEIIVVDDASTDNSVEVIEGFARRYSNIRFYRNPQNKGVVATIDRAFSLVTGEYVFGSAADDHILPGLFEKSLRLLAEHPKAALSCTISDYREAATGLNWHWGVGMADEPVYLSPARMIELERKGLFYIPPNSVIFKKSALVEAGGFRPELKFACDWFAMYVAGFRHGICFVPEPLAIFNVLPNSYYHKIRRDPAEYRKVLEILLQRLTQPENQDVVELLREAGAVFIFGVPMLKLLLSRPQYRRFITPTFLRKNLSHSIKLFLKNHSPASLVNFYLKLSGNRTRKATESPQKQRR